MCSPNSRTSFNFLDLSPVEFWMQSPQRDAFPGEWPVPYDWSHLYIFFFSSFLSCRMLRSIFLLVFLISPAGLKLQEVNRHFVFDLFCPWGLWECLPIMSWPIFRNRVWFLRCPCFFRLNRRCPSTFKKLFLATRPVGSLFHNQGWNPCPCSGNVKF